MKRVRLTVAYDGTDYCGWQLQPNGITIEEVLNRELSRLLKEDILVIGASRTDSGVHAEGNRAVFDTASRIPAEKISFALNESLPEDIRIRLSEEVPSDWHPRKCNSTKTYEYKIWNDRFELPTNRRYTHFVHVPLDFGEMCLAAKPLVGEHDFTSFCSRRTQKEDMVRTIYDLSLKQEGNLITIRISGNGFLYNMVRIIAGTLIAVGRGAYPPEHVEEILEGRDRALAGQTAPAKGLTLVGIEYETELKPSVTAENCHWAYTVYQDRIESEGVMYCIFERCEPEWLQKTEDRLALHAFRNGARMAYFAAASEVKNPETGEIDWNSHAWTCINDAYKESLARAAYKQ